MKKVIFILLILNFVNNVKAQQGNFIDKTGSSNILSFMNLSVPSGDITLAPFTTQIDLEDGIESSKVRFEIKSNRDWKLVTQIGTITSSPLAGGAGPATISFPLTYNHIKYSITSVDNEAYSGSTTFASTTAQLKSGVKGNVQKTGNAFHLKLRITPGYLVDPGNYTIPITFTLSAL